MANNNLNDMIKNNSNFYEILIFIRLYGCEEIYKKDNLGFTPLLNCVIYKHESCINILELLLTLGANINDVDNTKNNALMCAVLYGKCPEQFLLCIADTLLERGIDTYHKNNQGHNIIDICYYKNYELIMKRVLQHNKLKAQSN